MIIVKGKSSLAEALIKDELQRRGFIVEGFSVGDSVEIAAKDKDPMVKGVITRDVDGTGKQFYVKTDNGTVRVSASELTKIKK